MQQIWKILNNSFFGLILGIGLTIFLFFLENKSIKVGYSYNSTTVISSNQPDTNVKVFFKNDAISNLVSTEIFLWNHGGKYIDKNDISSTYPLEIKSQNKIKILNYEVIKTSRPNLKINITQQLNNSLIIGIGGDDGFEKYDGIKLRILYNGEENSSWNVSGRIKGNLNSFEKYQTDQLDNFRKKPWYYFVGFPLLLLLSVFSFFLGIKKIRSSQITKGELIVDFILPALIVAAFSIFVCIKIWYLIFYSNTLEWMF